MKAFVYKAPPASRSPQSQPSRIQNSSPRTHSLAKLASSRRQNQSSPVSAPSPELKFSIYDSAFSLNSDPITQASPVLSYNDSNEFNHHTTTTQSSASKQITSSNSGNDTPSLISPPHRSRSASADMDSTEDTVTSLKRHLQRKSIMLEELTTTQVSTLAKLEEVRQQHTKTEQELHEMRQVNAMLMKQLQDHSRTIAITAALQAQQHKGIEKRGSFSGGMKSLFSFGNSKKQNGLSALQPVSMDIPNSMDSNTPNFLLAPPSKTSISAPASQSNSPTRPFSTLESRAANNFESPNPNLFVPYDIPTHSELSDLQESSARSSEKSSRKVSSLIKQENIHLSEDIEATFANILDELSGLKSSSDEVDTASIAQLISKLKVDFKTMHRHETEQEELNTELEKALERQDSVIESLTLQQEDLQSKSEETSTQFQSLNNEMNELKQYLTELESQRDHLQVQLELYTHELDAIHKKQGDASDRSERKDRRDKLYSRLSTLMQSSSPRGSNSPKFSNFAKGSTLDVGKMSEDIIERLEHTIQSQHETIEDYKDVLKKKKEEISVLMRINEDNTALRSQLIEDFATEKQTLQIDLESQWKNKLEMNDQLAQKRLADMEELMKQQADQWEKERTALAEEWTAYQLRIEQEDQEKESERLSVEGQKELERKAAIEQREATWALLQRQWEMEAQDLHAQIDSLTSQLSTLTAHLHDREKSIEDMRNELNTRADMELQRSQEEMQRKHEYEAVVADQENLINEIKRQLEEEEEKRHEIERQLELERDERRKDVELSGRQRSAQEKAHDERLRVEEMRRQKEWNEKMEKRERERREEEEKREQLRRSEEIKLKEEFEMQEKRYKEEIQKLRNELKKNEEMLFVSLEKQRKEAELQFESYQVNIQKRQEQLQKETEEKTKIRELQFREMMDLKEMKYKEEEKRKQKEFDVSLEEMESRLAEKGRQCLEYQEQLIAFESVRKELLSRCSDLESKHRKEVTALASKFDLKSQNWAHEQDELTKKCQSLESNCAEYLRLVEELEAQRKEDELLLLQLVQQAEKVRQEEEDRLRKANEQGDP